MTILFLDDEPGICDIFRDTFTNETTEVMAFTNHDDAIALTRQRQVDLAFIDYHLDGITGVEVARNNQLNIPIVFITGRLDLNVEEENLKILAKPFSPEDVQDIIEAVRKNGNF
jgi:DNA-binding response OmpR family regulator